MRRAGREALIGGAILLFLFVLVAVIGVAILQGGSGATTTGAPRTGALPSVVTPAVDPDSGLPTIARSSLPREARATLDLIAAGGPFPYDQDGSMFQNRERLLPTRPAGTYREYTVETPGSPDRGARRIVSASTGEAYWTPDHYASFARILP